MRAFLSPIRHVTGDDARPTDANRERRSLDPAYLDESYGVKEARKVLAHTEGAILSPMNDDAVPHWSLRTIARGKDGHALRESLAAFCQMEGF